jgi:hypothetical protein
MRIAWSMRGAHSKTYVAALGCRIWPLGTTQKPLILRSFLSRDSVFSNRAKPMTGGKIFALALSLTQHLHLATPQKDFLMSD